MEDFILVVHRRLDDLHWLNDSLSVDYQTNFGRYKGDVLARKKH